jgi:hypothetical protein
LSDEGKGSDGIDRRHRRRIARAGYDEYVGESMTFCHTLPTTTLANSTAQTKQCGRPTAHGHHFLFERSSKTPSTPIYPDTAFSSSRLFGMAFFAYLSPRRVFHGMYDYGNRMARELGHGTLHCMVFLFTWRAEVITRMEDDAQIER